MLTVFDFENYKDFMRKAISQRFKAGRGERRRLAEHLRISTVAMSQILSGSRDLSVEQALEAADFFGLYGAHETLYFRKLVERARAGTERLRRALSEELSELAQRGRQVEAQVYRDAELGEAERTKFYSHWSYSAVRLATSVPELTNADALAKRFGFPNKKIYEILDFLVSNGMCRQVQGQYHLGPQATHLPASSPLIRTLHANWRAKALDSLDLDAESLHYTGPASISLTDFSAWRRDLLELIKNYSERVRHSPPETLACFTLDWFQF